ncbi:MAG: Phosphotransferase System HPr (HPr) Family [Firmicutes bacterium]|nr:Phosphotransferase System HPr (HPr) Family [Bacillota bacterium]
MKEIRYIVTDEIGLHARPAGLLVKTVTGFDSNITIKKGTMESNAKSIIGVMALGVKNGEEVTFIIDGSDEAEASETLGIFLNENL